MWALHDGQMVDLAAPLTSCLRSQSKHSMTLVRLLFHSPSNRCMSERAGEEACVRGSKRGRAGITEADRGVEGEK